MHNLNFDLTIFNPSMAIIILQPEHLHVSVYLIQSGSTPPNSFSNAQTINAHYDFKKKKNTTVPYTDNSVPYVYSDLLY